MIHTIILHTPKDDYDSREVEYKCPSCGSRDTFAINPKKRIQPTHRVCRWCFYKGFDDEFAVKL